MTINSPLAPACASGAPYVLLVEDEAAIADTIVYALTSEGFASRPRIPMALTCADGYVMLPPRRLFS